MNPLNLQRLDHRAIPEGNPDEVRVFSIVRNEMIRLPYFLEYHRKMGVSRFIFVDNNSSDGTRDFLLAQPDCHVFFTADSFAAATYGIRWSNHLLDAFGAGRWCLTLDADELLVYPHCEQVRLPELCHYLATQGYEGIYSFMLDMYPAGPVADAVCTPDKKFEDITPFFDRDYSFVNRIGLRGPPPFPRQEVVGGPRTRCFYDYQGHNFYLWRLFMHVVERGIVWLRAHGIKFPYIRLKATPLFKVPLVKWRKGQHYTASTHTLPKLQLADITCVLLHFKFFSDFHDKVTDAVRTGEHAEGSIEYKRYLERMDRIGNLMYEGSTRYTGSQSVLQAGLMQDSEQFRTYLSQSNRGAA